MNLTDLGRKVGWALEHDEAAHKIAKQGQRFASTHLRYDDMVCSLYRLLLEFGQLF